ncbi:superoxide dismutase, Cu-Zn family [Faunimonas pinastri]|uniref:Superoxide dismutase, Cu-Zn family n=1 Tax=Faunimonas pinastri TaxID=1855383 RepID=A0A1H9AG75_9HYPH|nr:superoxide dismutase family protein [Faunimonas pinastri]SEP75700.1 superoxide dismutase, Cu-Zn family [Faunimonas pinastri]
MKKLLLAGFAAAGLLAPACASAKDTASAAIRGLHGEDYGTVTLTDTTGGVLLKMELKGLPAGAHGVHIHATGKCDAPFSSAGAIYNPDNASHGFMSEDGPEAGDLPNIHVPESGALTVESLAPTVSLDEDEDGTLFDDDGSAIVITADADDYSSDPDGKSGARIACGIIK